MKKRNLAFAAAATAIIMVAGLAAFQPTASDAAAVNKAKGPQEATLDFTMQLPRGTSVAEIVDAVKQAANIGSSGLDGFAVDSFFDITTDFSKDSKGVEIEIIAMQLRAASNDPNMNAGQVIDEVKAAVKDKGGHEFIGHVTLIR